MKDSTNTEPSTDSQPVERPEIPVTDVTPIFVLGSARNGTTWLCNIFSGHTDIAAAQHPAHWGFHESNLFKNSKYWGDLGPLDRRIRFLELYTAGDHFQLVGGDRAALERDLTRISRYRSPDFYDAFFFTMDQFARSTGTKHWLTKLDPLFYVHSRELARFVGRITARYGTVHWVGIERPVADVVRSYLNMEGRATQRRTAFTRMPAFVMFETARHVVHYRRIRGLRRQIEFPIVSYRDLRSKPGETVADICHAVGLVSQHELHRTRYQANSSVAYRSASHDLAPLARWLIGSVLRPAMVLVWPVTAMVVRAREWTRHPVPPVYFKLQKLQRYPEAFLGDLRANDELALANLLFPESKTPEKRDNEVNR